MNPKIQRIILFGSLGVGYYIYRRTLREVIYQNQNTFINSPLLEQLKAQNYTIVGQNRVLLGNPINKTYDSSRERVVILGGGVIGLGTAYYLSKLKKYDVILVEVNENVAQTGGDDNGGVLCPSLSNPQTDTTLAINAIRSLYSVDTPTRFSPGVVVERYFSIWFTNYLLNMKSDVNAKGYKKLAHLANLGMEEINILNQEIEFKEMCNMTSKGTIHLNSSIDKSKKQIEVLKNAGASVRELDKDQLIQLEPALRAGLGKYESGYVGSAGTNININNFENKLANIAEINGVSIFTGTEFHRFLFQQETRKMIGVITSQGVMLCDKVVIASGIKTKDIAHKLGTRLPLLGFKQYSIAAEMPEHKRLSHNIIDDQTGTLLLPIKNRYFITGCNDLGTDMELINDERVQYLIRNTQAKVGEFNTNGMDVWAHTKALTSDDVPIISALPQYDNIYVNTGHGNKGLTLALGSGKVLSEIIDSRAKKEVEEDYSVNRFYLI